jgi:hypothetical protein
VALKTLPAALVTDMGRRARLAREARLLASLSHPHIAAIYGIEEADGITALVLELLDGETLADRLARGALPVNEAIRLAAQIADALEAAHQKGVIHRDLKPANIQITRDGSAKVLDFGLGKVLEPVAAPGDHTGLSSTATLAQFATREGVVLGTAAYMSPEQARGEPVDERADVWAFGVVLYEMLTGRRAFDRGTFVETVASVLESGPDLEALPAATPLVVRRPLVRCLAKAPAERLRHLDGARLDLLDALSPSNVSQPLTGGGPQWRHWSSWGGWAVAAVLVTVLALTLWRDTDDPPTVRRRRACRSLRPRCGSPKRVARSPSRPTVCGSRTRWTRPSTCTTCAPDRRRASRVSRDQRVGPVLLTRRAVDRLNRDAGAEAAPRAGRRGTRPGDRSVRRAERRQLGRRWPHRVHQERRSAVSCLRRGGEEEVLATPADENTFYAWPDVLPGSRVVLLTVVPHAGTNAGAQLAVLDVETGAVTPLLRGGTNPRYLTSGAVPGGPAARALPELGVCAEPRCQRLRRLAQGRPVPDDQAGRP